MVTPCPICSGDARRRYAGQPGYIAPATYDIYACDTCDTAFAMPLAVDPAVYERIYAAAGSIAGYSRYDRYARDVVRHRDPLRYLAAREDIYYAIEASLDGDARGRSVVEIGSGLGYLTYALSRRGYDATGVELSQTAVTQATRRFGPLFRCSTAQAFAVEREASVDVVVATEVIEHLENPLELLEAARRMLKPGGEFLVTTPNRTFYGARAVWHTDPPPVHLWWFSESSLRFLAARARFSVRFLDFRAYNRTNYARSHAAVPADRPSFPSFIGADGRAIHSDGAALEVVRRLGIPRLARRLAALAAEPLRSAAERFGSGGAGAFTRRPTLAAVFVK